MSPAGILVSLADRLDSLVGLVAVGCAPTGGADPFGLRRIAYGLLETLVSNQQRLDLPAAVQEAAKLLPCEVSQQSQVSDSLEACVEACSQRRPDNARQAVGSTHEGGCSTNGLSCYVDKSPITFYG